MIRVVCGCGRVFKAEDRHAGKRTRCPACGTNLMIGQTSSSGSGDAELEEVPSWWYPSAPPESTNVDRTPPDSRSDPESIPTAVLETGFAAPGGDEAGPHSTGRRARANLAPVGRPLWALAGAAAATVALGLAALCWAWWNASIPGETIARRAPRAVATDDDDGPSPHSDPIAARKGAAPVEVGPLGAEGFPSARSSRRLRLLVPAYIYPNAEGRLQWRRLMDAAAKVELVVIVNPDSGPGLERNADYAEIIAEAADRGVKLIGYVSTQYARRPVSEVRGDVDAWVRFYPRIGGIFLDQQPTDPRHSRYIAEISTHARGKVRDAIVIGNPGIPCDESYLSRHAADAVCVFANAEGFAAFEVPANLRAFDPSRCAALAYQVADAPQMQSMLKDAIIKRIGWIYVTDGRHPNPWNHLPAYWEAEVEAVTRLQ